ncbi:MAG: HAMP domain-containing histidine kinase [Deltaproteobacteria bacterium]|nr:HAMP domain-containing histidine kinase [Deltaproteobacteria bacterium]
MVDMPLKIGGEFKGVVSVGYDATNYYTHLSEIFRFGLLISAMGILMGILLCLLISAMGILMGILLSFQVSNPIVEPLRRLTDVTKRLAAGDLSQRATVGSKDEVGILAGAFNQMAHDLARYKEEADQYSKTLEEKVRQRTQALEISNQELRTIQNELMEANMVKSEFMSIASHELRTPLTTLLGYSELLLTRPLTDSQEKEFLGFINEESIRLSRIVDDLLDISRIESQKDFGFVRKPFSPAELVRKNIKVYAGTEAGHRIVAEVEENLPLVNVDAEKMGQVIKNLLDNAIKYSPFGDIVCKAFSENNMVWISVQDSGIGIFEGDIPRIFNKFFRVERKETEHVSGTGLGLSIAKYIVESHNGEITVESELDKGTTVSFGLPIYKD